LILISVAFNGIFKSQGAKVKLMVCKKTYNKMNKKCLETKTFTNNAKPTTFRQERLIFLFDFFLIFDAKLMKKDSFLATDATTKSSNQEENETRNFLFYFIAK
jgi:hypothetical protein